MLQKRKEVQDTTTAAAAEKKGKVSNPIHSLEKCLFTASVYSLR